jgi:hypothetical protein
MREDFLKHLPRCARCKEVLPPLTGPAGNVDVRFRYQGAAGGPPVIGRPLNYHAQCAPIVRGALLKPAHVHILPAPAVRNKRFTTSSGLIVWNMERTTKAGELLAYRAAIAPEYWPAGTREADAYHLRRARGLLQRAVAEQGGLAA